MLQTEDSRSKRAAEYLCSYDYGLGGLDDALAYADDVVLYERPSTMLEAFVGETLTNKAAEDARKVVAAATTPGTSTTQQIAGRLLRRSLELGKVAHERAQVAYRARQKRDELARKVERLQPIVERSSPDRASALKQDQYSMARAAVRLEKVNAVATGMAQNAAAQAVLAQQIAGSVIAGKPAITATLTNMYNRLGQSSASMRKTREQQIVNSADVLNQDKVRALLSKKRALLQQKLDYEVILTCAPRNQNVNTARRAMWNLSAQIRVINSEIQKLCTGRVMTALDLDGLEGLEGFFSSLKKAFKKVGRAVGGVVKAVGKPIVSVAESAVKVAVLPATTAAKLVTKGPSAAIKNIGKTMKDSFNTVRKAAGEVFIGLPCKFATSAVGKVAMQIGASVVGTAVGGPAGTVVGAVAANRAADLNKSVCGGLDKIGLTHGDFKTSKLGSALKSTALSIGKNLVDPKKLLRDATAAGGAFVGGSLIPTNLIPTDLLNKVGGEQLRKLGLDAITKNIGLPGGAAHLLKAVGVPTDVVGVLKAAGVPTDPASVLRAVGVPSGVKDVLRMAGAPTDLPSLLKATQKLQTQGLKPTPENLARAMGIKVTKHFGTAPVPGLPPVLAFNKLDAAKARKTANITLAKVRREAQKRGQKQEAAVRAKVQKLLGQQGPQDLIAQLQRAAQLPVFPAGSGASRLVPYV